MRFQPLLAAGALLLAASWYDSRAEVPRTIPLQAQVKTAGSQPVTTPAPFTFSLYTEATGGTAAWSETQTLTPANGLISTQLGTANPIAISFDQPLWVGITMGSDPEMTPRLPLASVPYALAVADRSVSTAKLADGAVTAAKLADSSVSTPKLANAAVTGAKLADSSVATAKLVDGAVTDTKIADAAVGNVELASDAASLAKVSGGAMASTSGRIGIGTAAPAKELQVESAGDTEIGLRSTDTGGRLWTLQSSGVTSAATDSTFQVIDRTISACRLLIDTSGNIGVGTTSPASKLAVAGVIQSTTGGVKFPDGTVQTTATPSSLPPSGTAGGDLTGTYPNPTIGTGKVTDAKIVSVSYSKITGAPAIPTTLPPSGPASGSLTGTYPSPAIAAGAVGTAELASDSGSLAKVSGGAMTANASGVSIGAPSVSGGPFQVYGGGATVDQEQTSVTGAIFATTAAGSCWQSFTAGAAGTLCAVEVYCGSWGDGAWTGFLKIRDGEGVRGTVLCSQTVGGDGSYAPHFWALEKTVAVESGHKYTISIDPNGGTVKWPTSNSDAYAGGVSADSGRDMWFRTYLSNSTTQPIITTQPNTGNVGIGTYSPGSKLTVAGVIQSTTGGVKYPDGTVQTTATPVALPPSGEAGGDLTGTYPNPTIAAAKVNTDKLADASVTTAKIADGAVASAELASDPASFWKVTGGSGTASNGTLCIGTYDAPVGPLQVFGTVGYVDQQNTSSNWDLYNLTDMWQSFTPSVSGQLAGVGLLIGSYSGNQHWSAALSIYSGEGTGGTQLSTQTIYGDGAVGTRVITLPAPVGVTAGSQYTIHVHRLDAGLNWRRQTAGGYAGGRSSFQPTDDQWFQTYMLTSLRQPALTVEQMSLNVGLGVQDPNYPLSFKDSLGDKIALYGQSGAHYGLGLQDNLLQIHTNTASGDVAFGYGSSSAFTETMRVKGNGNVGIGTSTPGAPLTFSSAAGEKISLSGDNGLGVQSGLLQIHSDSASSDIAFGTGTSAAFTEKMRVKGNGKVGIGTTTPNYTLQINGTLAVSSLPSGDYNNVQWNPTTGQFWQDTSSRRYKENITPLEDDFEKLLLAEPKTYTRPGTPDRWEIGYIAEEMDALGLKHLVRYDEQGRPDSVNYAKTVLYLTEIVKKQKAMIESLEERLSRLEKLVGASQTP